MEPHNGLLVRLIGVFKGKPKTLADHKVRQVRGKAAVMSKAQADRARGGQKVNDQRRLDKKRNKRG